MNILLILAIVFGILSTIFLCLFIKQRQLRRKWELACYCQKFDIFKQKASKVKSLTEATNLLQQYKNAVSASFMLNNSLDSFVQTTLVDKIRHTEECAELFSIIGDVAHKEETNCNFKLWGDIKIEVLSHLESISNSNPYNYWLKRLISPRV